MASPSQPSRLIGNIAALIGGVLLGAFFFDLIAVWLGYPAVAFCSLLRPVIAVAYGVGVLLASIGIIMWAASMGKSQAGIGLIIGGVMLFILPLVLPHYLGAGCIH